ncbi:putative protein kinase RLK-Pelle-WAK family [Helianthus annuus]|nr:putative protein kinase RLK-Pelle-WAK family [Helianthus annuus]
MKLFQAYLHLLIFLLLTATSIAAPKYAKTGCNDTCGNVRIPYPFGIGSDCAVNQWYTVDCNSSTPYLSALNLEVLRVSLENLTVTVSTPMITVCQNTTLDSSEILGVDLGSSPFLFSKSHNRFVFEGCGYAVVMHNYTSVISTCLTNCINDTVSDRNDTLSDTNNCIGFSCCQTTIPHHLKSYTIRLRILESKVEDKACGSAFLVDITSFDQKRFPDPFVLKNTSFIPVSLVWTLASSDQITCCNNRTRIIRKVDVFDSTPVDTWLCDASRGTPYLVDGCDDHEVPTEECKRCEDRGGFCDQDTTYYIDGSVFSHNTTCNYYDDNRKSSKTSLGVILGVSISMGVLFLVAISYVLYKAIKKTKEKRRRQRFFKRNGGLLLKQQEEADPTLIDKTILFTSHELEKATDNFNENRILGRGGQGTVYKGMLVDGRIVAVKKSKIVDKSRLEQFINEVVILSQINHRNVVKLLGCCLETYVPLLVSEFVPNGTLYDRLHNKTEEFPISLSMRLQIATEVAGALAYLHSATSIPIYHRDVKTTNILLDYKYRAKISDFGTSRFVSREQTHLTTLVKGTFGYLDPEYFQSSQFTEKSDVYSFGVVLVELLTGEKPISINRFGEHRSLATHFLLAMEEGRVMSVFDAMVIKEATRDELLHVANLAMRCLSWNGRYRPTMKEVVIELETIRTSHMPSSIIHYSISPMINRDELSMLTYGESSSKFLSFNDRISE